MTGAAVGTMAVLDRRSLGAQTEDQAIELRGLRELNDEINNSVTGSISITSFNRRVLLSGQADSAADASSARKRSCASACPTSRTSINEVEVVNAVRLRDADQGHQPDRARQGQASFASATSRPTPSRSSPSGPRST